MNKMLWSHSNLIFFVNYNKPMNSKASNETILVTGAAGFIGAALVKLFLTSILKL